MPTVSVAEAQKRLSEYVADVERTQNRVTITRHGRPAVVLISADDLDALEETVSITAEQRTTEAIAEGLADLEHGRVADNEELRGRFTT